MKSITSVPAEVAIARQAFRTMIVAELFDNPPSNMEKHERHSPVDTRRPLFGQWVMVDGVLAQHWTR